MKLKIINPIASSFNESVGITEERANELGKHMDAYVKTLQGQTVRTCDVMAELCAMCCNLEEVIFCVISHSNYMIINHGIFLCPPKIKI